MKNGTTPRLAYFDGLRGIAALIVYFHHFLAAFYPAVIFGERSIAHHPYLELLIYSTPLNLLFAGNFSVTLFFVLSGFVLSHNFFKDKKIIAVQKLAISRYIRLTLPVFVSVMIGYLLLRFGLFFHELILAKTNSSIWLGQMFQQQPVFIDALNQGLFNIYQNHHNSDYNRVIWSMYYEFWGSFLVFAFIVIFGSYRFRVIFYLFLILFFWKSYFLGFILGMITADFTTKRFFARYLSFRWVGYFLLIVGLIFGSYPLSSTEDTIYKFFYFPFLEQDKFVIFFHTIGAFLVISCLPYIASIQHILQLPIFQHLGKISFSLYLIHTIILFSFSSLLFYVLNSYISYDSAALLTFIISTYFTILCSRIYAHLVDTKSILLSKKFL